MHYTLYSVSDQLSSSFSASNPFQSEPIKLRVQNPRCNVRWLDVLIQERVRKKFRIELCVIRRAEENKVANTPDFVSAAPDTNGVLSVQGGEY